MSDFLGEQLRKALSRQEAPEGFAERVLAAVPGQGQRRSKLWYPAIAASVAIALLFGGMEWRQEQRVHARETERQVVFALALAMQKFEHVNSRLQQSAAKVKVDEKRGEL
ncbi:MAG TPA: hypothetical protein VH351_17550 [Bryobacteraceae bacterium]|jgi:hypothetical protein|nr:hypothetical protein [Bryobacteraceae bacterium]